MLAVAAAAAVGHEPAAVLQALAKLAGEMLLSEQEMAMLREVASPRVAASRLEPRYQRAAAAAAAAAATAAEPPAFGAARHEPRM